MGALTAIEWTDMTWSPWEGCQKVGPCCDHCYAESMNHWLRRGENWGPGAQRRIYSDAHWAKPARWNESAARIDKLIDAPVNTRFLSMEPLLGPVNLYDWIGPWGTPNELQAPPMIDGIFVGGESGRGARPMHPSWARSLRDQCTAAGVAYHFKQWGEWAPGNLFPGSDLIERDRGKIQSGFFDYNENWNPLGPDPFCQTMDRIGKKAAGRELDGRIHDDFPRLTVPLLSDAE
ncbi:DUF5131 family protein [Paraburkholderia largidicola]|uniref:Uncharacterized protein n=1 Tax=Paraburkholderia largidicola TaxID=3014751 RepID=A0A7I8C280_9BURK|nr:DUF5131 family protein [Paraburkholderia sp. PGU16]BCF95177.1 hypothetical protein PPGU16_82440 [Paraburkholderia sp. PGU16]